MSCSIGAASICTVICRAISKLTDAWDMLELLPPVDWPEAVSWDFTLEELRIPKVKETVKMMVANPPAVHIRLLSFSFVLSCFLFGCELMLSVLCGVQQFNSRMTQWVLDSFRKFIGTLSPPPTMLVRARLTICVCFWSVKRFDSVVKPVFARKPLATPAPAAATATKTSEDASGAAAATPAANQIAAQTVLDALRGLLDDLNTIQRLAGIEEIVQYAAQHYHKQIIVVFTTKLLKHPLGMCFATRVTQNLDF